MKVRFEIPNFTNAHTLRVRAYERQATDGRTVPAVVTMTAGDGAVYFRHDMLVDQARYLADALLACVAELEAVSQAVPA